MKRLLAVLPFLLPATAPACDELVGVYGFQMVGAAMAEYFNIRKVENSYVVYANQGGKWELTPNSFLYLPVEDPAWIGRVTVGATPVCAIEMISGSMFGVFRENAAGKLVYFTQVGETGKTILLIKTRAGAEAELPPREIRMQD
ncbi:MAG: hypothetical protein K0R03_2423 [Moraxellaceae bacterium]|jgi:hypothetical protein|nr:hypothetical protein [Moraxellaceae bacterium]